MSEETRLVLQAIIGILVAVVVAFVTSWLNRKYFREQLGEQRYAEVYLDKTLDLWGEVWNIYHDTVQLTAEIRDEAVQRKNKEGLSKAEINPDLAQIHLKRIPQLAAKVMALEKYYLILRQRTVNTLQEMERMLNVNLVVILKNPGEHDLAKLTQVMEEVDKCSNVLIQQLRSDASHLASRKITVSEILAEDVDITPPHVKELSLVQDHTTDRSV